MKRTCRAYTDYRPSSHGDSYTVWVEYSNGGIFDTTEMEIAGTYENFAEAHTRQEEVAENYRILGYKVTVG